MRTLLLLILLLLPAPAFAWGKEGHEAVGIVADKFLGEKSRAALQELLKDDQFKSIADGRLGNWADSIRGSAAMKRKYPANDKFHYLDIDVDVDLDKVDVAKVAEGIDCAPKAVANFRKTLIDKAAPIQDRREALFFIVHILGDLHQPLHCADRTGDRGGNLAFVLLPKTKEKINLHKVWDTTMVLRDMGDLTVADYAAKLIGEVEAEAKPALQKGTVNDWILDGTKIARDVVYKGVPKTAQTGDPVAVDDAYLDTGAATVRKQITKGDLRLAAYLDECFKE